MSEKQFNRIGRRLAVKCIAIKKKGISIEVAESICKSGHKTFSFKFYYYDGDDIKKLDLIEVRQAYSSFSFCDVENYINQNLIR